jgi:hypothetical protein
LEAFAQYFHCVPDLWGQFSYPGRSGSWLDNRPRRWQKFPSAGGEGVAQADEVAFLVPDLQRGFGVEAMAHLQGRGEAG